MRYTLFTSIIIILSLFISNDILGQRRVHRKNNQKKRRVVVVKKRTPRTVRILPTKHTVVVHKKRNYHFHSGNYYRYSNNRYVMVYPPRGFRVRTLPVGHRIILVGGVKRYYYRGLFYKKTTSNEFEVIEPEIGTIVPELPSDDIAPSTIDGNTIYEYNSIVYEPITVGGATQYRVTDILKEDTE